MKFLSTVGMHAKMLVQVLSSMYLHEYCKPLLAINGMVVKFLKRWSELSVDEIGGKFALVSLSSHKPC